MFHDLPWSYLFGHLEFSERGQLAKYKTFPQKPPSIIEDNSCSFVCCLLVFFIKNVDKS